MKNSRPLIPLSRFMIFIGLLLVSLSFQRCNHKMDEVYFQDIQPPADYIPFELSLDSAGDTLYLTEPTAIQVNFEANRLEIYKVIVYLDDLIVYDGLNPKPNISLDPERISPDYYTFSVYIFTNSATGSVADQVGQEGYRFEGHWTLAIDSRIDIHPKPNFTINEDGYMCIHWKPTDHYAFRSYTLTVNDANSSRQYETHHRNDTLIIDSCYNYGNMDAYTMVNRMGHQWTNNQSSYSYYEAAKPQLQFQEISPDSMIIYWHGGVGKSIYTLPFQSGYYDPTEDTFLVVRRPPLGRNVNYRFNYKPKKCNYSGNEPFIYQSYESGIRIAFWETPYAFSAAENIVYATDQDSLFAVDIESLQKIKTHIIPGIDYLGVVCSQYNSSKMAVLSAEKIHLFDNSQFTNPTEIQNTYNEAVLEHIYYTTNNKIAGARNGLYSLYKTNTLVRETTILYDRYPHPTSRNYVGTHRDGQFVTFALEHKIQHYKIENQSASLIYEDFTTYNSVLYSETEPNLIYLSRSDIPLIELRNAIDFSLISTINLDNIVVIRNIDPISGYMLLRRIGFLHILDLQTQNLILTVDSQDTRPKLYDSKVFLESGYCVDFKPFLP